MRKQYNINLEATIIIYKNSPGYPYTKEIMKVKYVLKIQYFNL